VVPGALLLASSVFALPTGTLQFVQSSGAVSPTESIDIVLRMTLASNSTPLVIDDDGHIVIDIAPEILEQGGLSTLLVKHFFLGYGCNFFCGFHPYYTYNWGDDPTRPVFRKATVIEPGESVDFIFGRLTPTRGRPVPEGTFQFFDSMATYLALEGLNENGDLVFASLPFDDNVLIAKSCPEYPSRFCMGYPVFERTVVATALGEPAVSVLMGGMLLALLSRRRRLASQRERLTRLSA